MTDSMTDDELYLSHRLREAESADTRPYKLTYEQAEEALHEWLERMDGSECFPGITEEMLDPMTLAWQEAYRVGRGTATP